MNTVKLKVKKILNKIRGLFPSKVPTGVAEFHAWADSLIETYDFPTKDSDSIKFALATMVMHLGPKGAYKSKVYFALCINAGAAKQVASEVFREIKVRQEQKHQEATQKAASDGTK